MASYPYLAQYALLLHVLLPFAGAGLLAVFGNFRFVRRCELAIMLGLAATSLLLLIFVSSLPADGVSIPVIVSWQLPGARTGIDLVDRVLWGVDTSTAGMLAVIPWLALTVAQVGRGNSQPRAPGSELWLLGAMDLFLVGWDFGSMLAGAAAVATAIAIRVARFGGNSKRSGAATLMTAQYIGIGLIAFALASFAASAGVIRAAPRGAPAASAATLPTLADEIQTAFESRPGAPEIWRDSQGLPVILLIIGAGLLCAVFPLHSWFSESVTAAATGERLWLIAWMKVVLLVAGRVLFQLDRDAMAALATWGSILIVAGAVFTAAQLYAHTDFPKLQSAALFWSQQIAALTLFLLPGKIDRVLMPLLLVQLAGLVLWSISLSTISDRYGSVELNAYQGLSHQAGWLGPALLTATMLLTLTPLGTGLFQAWLATTAYLNAESLWGSCCRLGILMADLLVLAGFLRVGCRLVSGPPRLPEMSPVLRARAGISVPQTSLQLSLTEGVLLWGWGMAGVLAAILLPLFMLLAGGNDTGG